MIEWSTLMHQLGNLGISNCSPLMVHASLRKTGFVQGGGGDATMLLDALVENLGEYGTLLMVLGADDDEPFDALTTPVDTEDMGMLCEVFRQHKGIQVNDHAAARFGAYGPLSTTLLQPVPLHDYYGSGSVLERFSQHDGWVLRLGANIDTVTLTHFAEYEANVNNKRRVRRRYVRADTGEQWIDSLDDSDGIADWPQGDYFSQILLDFLQAGHARVGPVGNCSAELFAARTFVDFSVRWMEANL